MNQTIIRPKRMVTIIKSYKLTKAKMFIVQLEIPK